MAECDMLEDTFSARSDAMTRINVIRNAAHRIANAIESQSWPAEMFAGGRRDPRAQDSGEKRRSA